MSKPKRITWLLADLARRGEVHIAGAPRLTFGPRPLTQALWFDGVRDGLIVPMNPVAGARSFFVEVLFCPEEGGAPEERFLHVQETGSPNRLLLETRRHAPSAWYLDTYVQAGSFQTALNDPHRLHAAGRWSVAGLYCGGGAMVQLYERQVELEAAATFEPLGAGSTALGMRANAVSHFRGAIYAVRFTTGVESLPRALVGPPLR